MTEQFLIDCIPWSKVKVKVPEINMGVKLHGLFIISCESAGATGAWVQHCVQVAMALDTIQQLWSCHPPASGNIHIATGPAIGTFGSVVGDELVRYPARLCFYI